MIQNIPHSLPTAHLTPNTLHDKTTVIKRLVYSRPPPTQSPQTPEPSPSPSVHYPDRTEPETLEEFILLQELDDYFEDNLSNSDDSDLDTETTLAQNNC